MKRLIAISIFLLYGCATSPLSKSSDVVEIVSTGNGVTEKEAIDNALREAAVKATGMFIYSDTRVENRVLTQDKIAAYAPGVITDYSIISSNKADTITTVTVKSFVRKDVLRERIERTTNNESDPIKVKIAEVREITDIQKKFKEGKKLMKTLLGSPDDFFNRAYSAKIIGYEVSSVNSRIVEGTYSVELSLNKVFWDNYIQILSVVDIKNNSRMLGTQTIPQGLYNGCYDRKFSNPYTVPSEIEAPYTVDIYYDMIATSAYSKESMHNLMLKQNGIVFNNLMRGSGVLIGSSGMFSGTNVCDKTGSSFVTFKDKVVLKFPFQASDLEIVKRKIEANKIGWIIKTIPNYNP